MERSQISFWLKEMRKQLKDKNDHILFPWKRGVCKLCIVTTLVRYWFYISSKIRLSHLRLICWHSFFWVLVYIFKAASTRDFTWWMEKFFDYSNLYFYNFRNLAASLLSLMRLGMCKKKENNIYTVFYESYFAVFPENNIYIYIF